jgi:hypothetical protein
VSVAWSQVPDLQSVSEAHAPPLGSAPHVIVPPPQTPEVQSPSAPHFAPSGRGAPQTEVVDRHTKGEPQSEEPSQATSF